MPQRQQRFLCCLNSKCSHKLKGGPLSWIYESNIKKQPQCKYCDTPYVLHYKAGKGDVADGSDNAVPPWKVVVSKSKKRGRAAGVGEPIPATSDSMVARVAAVTVGYHRVIINIRACV